MSARLLLQIELDPQSGLDGDRFECAHTNGFDGLEFVVPIDHTSPPERVPSEESLEVDGGRPLIIATGGLSTNLDAATGELIDLLGMASRCGAIGLNLGLPPAIPAAARPSFHRYQDALNFTHALLCRVRDEVEGVGVPLGVEAASGGFLLSPVELRELLDEVNSWAFGVCVDVDRIARIGSPSDWIATLGPRVRSVRLEGSGLLASPESSESLALVEAALKSLHSIDYEGPIVVSHSGQAVELPSVARWLRERLAS